MRSALLRLARPIYYRLHRAALRFRFALSDYVQPLQARPDGSSVPPALLRFRVGESTDTAVFLAVGENASDHIQAALNQASRPIEDSGTVLDFGCGCGRIIAPLARRFPKIHFYGTDVDAAAIQWDRQHLPCADFRSNGPLPPLEYADGQFDLVYCVSVFTHLSDQHQRQWLSELRRVIRPGGTLLLTAHGERVWRDLPAERRSRIENEGYLFERSQKLRGIVPDWYHTAYHTEKYLRALVSGHFRVLAYIQGGLGYQDVVVAERLRDATNSDTLFDGASKHKS